MTGKKFALRSRLLQMVILYSGIGLLLPLLLELLLLIMVSKKQLLPLGTVLFLFLCLVCLQAGTFYGILLVFHRKIYEPVTTIEKVIHGVASDKNVIRQIKIEEENELYGLYKNLNSILSTLEELAAKESRAILMKKKAELDALQSQINPHFLYNTLESIRGQAMAYGIWEIEIMTKALSNLFRYSISNDGNMVPLSRELKNIDNYFMIQQFRFNNKFTKIDQVEEDTKDCLIPKLLLQPIVENAVHHGLEPKLGEGKLVLQAYRTKNHLVIHVIDNGIGMEEEKVRVINEALRQAEKKKGMEEKMMRIGILNVNERIHLAFGTEYGLHIYSTDQVGTDVEFLLPVKKMETTGEPSGYFL